MYGDECEKLSVAIAGEVFWYGLASECGYDTHYTGGERVALDRCAVVTFWQRGLSYPLRFPLSS